MTHLLFKATTAGDLDRVRVLLQQGADVGWTHKGTGRTALSEAAIHGHTAIVSLLLEQGADINWRDRAVGYTPLGWSSSAGHIDTVRHLVQAGADVNLASIDFLISPLMQAVMGGHLDMVALLLAAGANVHALTSDGCNALSMATQPPGSVAAALLRDAGARLPAPAQEPVALAWPDVGVNETAVDFQQPQSVLRAFILAMNRWESHAAEPGSTEVLERIFAQYCTPKDRPYGRNGSYRDPPEYDVTETLLAVALPKASRAELVTREGKNTPLLTQEHLYVLIRKAGRWALDGKKSRWVGQPDWRNGSL